MWSTILNAEKVKITDIYVKLIQDQTPRPWRRILYDNGARPRAKFILWLACHGKLATKERLKRFDIMDDDTCSLCSAQETQNHLFFECDEMKSMLKQVLSWIKVQHSPGIWDEEINGLRLNAKGKGWKAKVLKIAYTETIYNCWLYRNDRCFENIDSNRGIVDRIIDTVIYRPWLNPKLRHHASAFMMP
ncbi:uncharacterized protein LOC131619534 [Vicia villosa]|uniref:uncharacterized protein LOC131619527 n=1 Tax=Vicia villosa TaxID=3911 RepID=UPI00273AA527|nr:uncharacterized protein LOC131619527 [Vicia villosa]XP_058746605.1 uncharacterized protein LOC131619534 [Vicia villosa]